VSNCEHHRILQNNRKKRMGVTPVTRNQGVIPPVVPRDRAGSEGEDVKLIHDAYDFAGERAFDP
jgi:hypothetical protein